MHVINGRIPLVSVKTNKPIQKDKISKLMMLISSKEVKAPIKTGDVILNNVLNTGIDIVSTRDVF